MSGDVAVAQILGQVQILRGDDVVDLPSASQRRLLAALAIHAPRPVRSEWLCGVLDVTPGALRQSVARLRRVAGTQVLRTCATGYQLDATVDATLAETEFGQAANDPANLSSVLDRWDGPSIAEFANESWAVGAAGRLDELRASIVESLAESLIDHNRVDEAIGVLEAHTTDHPFRDHPRGLLIRALAAAGRRTEALRAYSTYQRLLADEVGLEPSTAVREIERRVVSGWDGRRGDHEPGATRHDTPPKGRRQLDWPVPPQLPELLLGAAAPLGRQGDVAAIAAAADSVLENGQRGVVLVAGEAGIGKTTLVAEFARQHGTLKGRTVWYCRSDELGSEPLQPFRGLISQILEALPDDVLSAHVAARGHDLRPLLPHSRRLGPHTTVAIPTDEITARHLLFEAVADLVRRAAEIGPLIIVIDDLHWADPAGLQLLRHLERNLTRAPVLFVVCFRNTGEADSDDVRTTLAELARTGAVRIELGGLDAPALCELVWARASALAVHDVSSVADLLGIESAGNPLFAEHLLDHWTTSGQLHIVDGVVAVSKPTAADLPPNLRDLVWYRVAALGPLGHTVLSAAAVLGSDFDESLLAPITGFGRDELVTLLDKAVTAGLLVADQPQVSTLRFAHPLVAGSLEGDLGPRERTRLHGRSFEALLASGSDKPAQLAHHAERAGLLDASLLWSARAGERALIALTPDEAADWFGRALRHAEELGRGDAERASLLAGLGEAAYRAGHPTAIDTLHAAAELALRSGADDTLLRAAFTIAPGSIRLGTLGPKQLAIAEAALKRTIDADDDTRALVLAMLARGLVHTDQAVRRRTAAIEAEALARDSDDPNLLARVAPDLLFALWGPGAANLRLRIARDAIDVTERSGEQREASHLYHAAHTAAVCAGDEVLAAHCADRLRSLAEEINEPRVRWLSALIDGFDATMECRFDEAEELIAACYAIGGQIGESEAYTTYAAQFFTLGSHRGRRGEMFSGVPDDLDTTESVARTFEVAYAIASLEVGRRDNARTVLDEALERDLAAIPADFMQSTLMIGLAILTLGLHDATAAEKLLTELDPIAGEVSFNGAMSQGPISLHVGRLATLAGRFDDAERNLLEAVSVTERFGWHYHRVTALCGLLENRLSAAGEIDRVAVEWLDEADRLCTAHGIAGWTRRVSELRSQLNV